MDIKGYEKFGVLPFAKWDYEPVKAANELMMSGKVGEGIEQLQKLAEDGNAIAMFYMGYHYIYGNGVEEDEKKAVEWYRKAADAGEIESQMTLGFSYKVGRYGLEEDYHKAIEWYEKAALQNFAEAQKPLGCIYLYKGSTEEDNSKAIYWLTKAAESGHPHAQHTLGNCYAEGKVVKQDYQQALKWYKKASANEYCAYNAGRIYYEVEKNYEEALKWLKLAAESKERRALTLLGEMYEKGEGVHPDMKIAVDYYMDAAEHEDGRGQYNLARCYENGIVVEKDIRKAVEWYREASWYKEYRAINRLGEMLMEGILTNKNNVELARKYFEKAARCGNADAQKNLEKYFGECGE